jgi:hypothetical protein
MKVLTGRRGKRRKWLMNDLQETRGYWKLKKEALDRTLWRTRFRRGYGRVQHNCGMNEDSRFNSSDSKQVNQERQSEV